VGAIPASASSATTATTTTTTTTTGGGPRTAREVVGDALKVGYRFLECAEFYGNEVQVGQAIADSGIARKELFLCSKVWTTTIEQGPDAIRAQLDKTLSDLGTDYLDLYVGMSIIVDSLCLIVVYFCVDDDDDDIDVGI
jgi:diketogulonate reductase-like aldo/keto reductase